MWCWNKGIWSDATMSRSIIMVDWSRYNQPTADNLDEFLWEQMFLSLLYDEVWAQDETLVCSKKMAKWFSDSETFKLLEQLVECRGLSVLKRPLKRYPLELQERALAEPITARREHLERFSVNNNAAPLRFSRSQRAFHNKLEALLINHPQAHRDAGAGGEKGPRGNLMKEFADLLTTVLTDPRYKKWLRRRFKKITPSVAEEFVNFVHYPARAIERIRLKRPDHQPRFTPQSGRLVFSTALAVQVAATYESEAAQLQSLIESVFARPFCEEEGAEGRYSNVLRDLPYASDGEEDREANDIQTLKVEVAVKIPLSLPSPGPNFANTMNDLRSRDSAKHLRAAMRNLGQEATFTTVENAWKWVSQDMASLIASRNRKKVNLWMLAVRAGRSAICGAVMDFLLRPTVDDVAVRLLGPATGALVDVGGGMFAKLARADLERQRITPQIEQAVRVRCVPHPTINQGLRP
jgi:hypothetical protein